MKRLSVVPRVVVASFVLAVCSSLFSRIAFADILWDQQGGSGLSIGSTQFTAPFEDSNFVSDDFVVGAPGWKIFRITLYGRELGDPSLNEGVKLAILSSPAHDDSAPTFDGNEVSAGGKNRNLIFDFGSPLVLAPGTYWLSGWVIRPDFNDGGFWAWRAHKPVTLSESYWHDPSGGSGLGTDPLTTSVAFGIDPQDTRFTIKGVLVPEPSAAALLSGVAVIAAFAAKRRRRRLE